MARNERPASKTSNRTAVPPPKSVLISCLRLASDVRGGRLTRMREPLSPPKNAPQIHMFCTVILRCESSAGLGEPVEPVVKMTSAPSSAAMWTPASRLHPVACIFRSLAASTIEAKDRVPEIATSDSTAMKCLTQSHLSRTALHNGRRSSGPFTPNPANPRGRRISRDLMISAAVKRRSSGATITPILKHAYSSST